MTQFPVVKPFLEVLSGHRQPVPPLWSFFQNSALVLNTLGYFAFIYVTFLLLTKAPPPRVL